MIRIVGTFAVALALVGVGGAHAGSTGGEALSGDSMTASKGKIANPDYVGKGRFDPTMKVEFRIHEKGGRELVDFQARNVNLLCNDNTEQERRDLIVVRARMDEDGRSFDRVLYSNSNGDGVYWFGGKLIDSGRRAKGFVLLTDNPPQAQEDAGLPECTTFGKRHWIAKRVGT